MPCRFNGATAAAPAARDATRPLVSVLLPVRDGGALLRAAVDSVFAQTLNDLEIIVVDDHSRDGAVGALPQRPGLRRLRNPGRGIVSALNAAAAAARGVYLARMDGDDIALPQRLARQVALLKTCDEVGIAGAEVEIFTDVGTPRAGYRRYQDWINGLRTPQQIRRDMFVESPIPHPSALLTRALFERLGGYRDTPWPEDYDLWLRAFELGVGMAKPDGVLLRWRDHPARLSRNDRRYGARAFVDAKAYYLTRCVVGQRPVLIWGAGRTGTALCDALRVHGVEVRGFVDVDAAKIGRTRRGLSVHAWQRLRAFPDCLILAAVGNDEARSRIRAALCAAGRREGDDFWVAA